MISDAHHPPAAGTTLVGRGAELGRIVDALRAAKRATPSALLVEGTPGLGKTALLDVAHELAHERGFTVCRAKASPVEREVPFAVVQQLFDQLREEISARRDDKAVQHACDVIAGHGDDWEQSHVDRAIHSLYRFAAELALRTPLCLLVDDVHWADVPSSRWLNHLAHRMAKLPVVLLMTRTPGIRPTDPLLIAELELCSERVRLPFFTAENLVRLTEQFLGRTPDDKFTEALLDGTGGCPTVTHHFLSMMRDRSVVPDENAVSTLLRPESEKLGQSLLARLNRQSPELVDVAKAVAVVEPSGLDLLTAVLDVGDGETADRVRQLARMGVLMPDGGLRFTHRVIKNTIESAIGYREREELHASAARFLHHRRTPAPVVAHHVLRTSSQLGAWAVEVLGAAARTAVGEGDARSGARLLTRALTENLSIARRKDVLLRLGLAEACFDPRMAVVHLEEGMAGLDDREPLLKAACRLTQVLYLDGAYDTASEVLRRAKAVIGPDDPVTTGMIRLLERVTVPSHDPEAWRVDFRQADEREWRRGDARGRALAGLVAEDASSSGADLPTCRKAALAALSGGAAAILQNPRLVVAVLDALLRADEADLVLRHCDEILFEARRHELTLITLLGHTLRSRAHHLRGSFGEAVADAELASSLARTAKLPDDHFGQVNAVDALARAQVALGDVNAAQNALRPFGGARELPRTWHHTALLHARGAVRLELGDTEGALADQLECGERFQSWGRPSPTLRPWRSSAALAHLRLGQPKPALDLALQELTLAREWGAPTTIGRALLTVGIATGGTAATPWLTEADSVLRRSPARMLHAQVLLELAATRWEKGQHDTARHHLAEAQELGRQCGVEVEPGKRIHGLASTGAPPARVPQPAEPTKVARPAPRINALTLTPHEHRVAGLVLDGKSNDEIAHELGVSRRTVEFHLTGIYRKLGIRRRTQLPAALAGYTARG
ncbi:helix-turn-helix transcriptional regulator [Lentzea sp. NEAU-D7]|uniref:helix-turn-helix transcriptional regulator n=1 Tax=Lentzea sp. NEAU-D7 TaxID=2994667 RepID=UPI00224AF343|nr:LuxR family transcriptional regulator [Lentzea sp. NEAU-D7]MCX2954723.1 AAA family ATPase [Lentzea sp. NEAU-D7]